MSKKHPALTYENLTRLEGMPICEAQRMLMAASDQSLPGAFGLNNDSILYAALIAEEGGESIEGLVNAINVLLPGALNPELVTKLAELGSTMRQASKQIRAVLATESPFAVKFDLDDSAHRAVLKPLIDGAADTVVVTAGLMNATGMDGQLSYAAAQQSNHTKIDPDTGKMFKGPDGKWIKGPYFTEPDWDRVIDMTEERRSLL